MLLIGIWINFTKKPINPIIAKPIAVAIAIFWNSANTKNKIQFRKPHVWHTGDARSGSL